MSDESRQMQDKKDHPGRMGWVLLALGMILCVSLGYGAARLTGFPYYPGKQGVWVQQPWPGVLLANAGMLVGLIAGISLAGLMTNHLSHKAGFCLGMMVLGGFSLRGGTMESVLQATGGREIFWFLAVELLAYGLVGALLCWLFGAGKNGRKNGLVGKSLVVQFIVITLVILVLGQSERKLQASMAVFLASLAGSWAALWITGSTSAWNWCMPWLVGVMGYLISAGTATGIEISQAKSLVSGLAVPLPLDYAAWGAIGTLLGEMLAYQGRQANEEEELELKEG